MSPSELKEYAAVMREMGVKVLAIDKVCIEMDPSALLPIPTESGTSGPVEHKPDESISSVLKMSDSDLIDKLFPQPDGLENEAME